ncbi:MAG: bifunctional metallophosphatase/5'-nucleotidase [Bacteroidota bacterium]
MKTIKFLLPFLLLFSLMACHTAKGIQSTDADNVEITLLQMNDVYEISPSPDQLGGLARVATLRKTLLAKNPNTITVLSGDFISPSVIGTLKYEGKRIRGKQMVETLNTLGLDWVVFGNHEFDYDDQADLQARLDESNFGWLAGNVRLKNADGSQQPFFKNKGGQKVACPDYTVIPLKLADGSTLRLGLFGALINTGRKPWAVYSDYIESAKASFAALKPQADVIVGITHLAIEDDKKLLLAIPELPLIMGGHEHENSRTILGQGVVTKADANAKTVYIHTIRYNKKTKKTTVFSELRRIDGKIQDDPATAAVVAKWEKIKTDALASSGFDASKKVTDLTAPLDCREITIRYQQASVGKMIGDAMIAAGKFSPDCAILNSGSIRVDDILSGSLYEIDIVRMLPFGGGITEVEMRGTLLRKTLETGWANKGSGGYLQWSKIRYDEAAKKWFINEIALDDKKTYKVILPDFLLSGNEQNMSFLKTNPGATPNSTDNPEIPVMHKPVASDKTDLRNDIRLALIGFLRK